MEKVEVKIDLNSIEKVKNFSTDVSKLCADVDLVSGRYVVDAKSIMGIFSLDLSKPIDLVGYADTMQDAEKIVEFANKYAWENSK